MMEENNAVSLKTIKDLLGMNFFIPDYQRGYRWEGRQARELLEDIYAFSEKATESAEIYCIQPLVVQRKAEDILQKVKTAETLSEVEKYLKGAWNVVDGQQRLTTIYLILLCLGLERKDMYTIDYETREGSKDFLCDPREDNCMDNIDYYHIYQVYAAIKEWLDSKADAKEKIQTTLLHKVNFIWYQISDTEKAISVFTRLNIGKIPLTDAELVKALFLNRTNFKASTADLDTKQHQIAMEWDQIEYTLQNDEFWLFIHGKEYAKPTRIDFILDMICDKDGLKLYDREARKGKNKIRQEKKNAELDKRIGKDEHQTFRYFYEAFSHYAKPSQAWDDETDRLARAWNEIKKYDQVFNEWYHDYRLYHYVGYLTTIQDDPQRIGKLIDKWEKSTKEAFVKEIKKEIASLLAKKPWFTRLKEYKFDEEYEGRTIQKTECSSVLLLHNIETMIRQNEKLVSEKKYNLPNFTKFPFHLYKSEDWQVEHIRPNADDDLCKWDMQKVYLLLAKQYLSGDNLMCEKIDDFVYNKENHQSFEDILAEIENVFTAANDNGGPLSEEDKNKIWNYVLLDASTNKEYGNAIFPIKRAFIANKEQGFKVQYAVKNNRLVEKCRVNEVAFVPPCTKNVFSKFYTRILGTMTNWTRDDAEAYLADIIDKLNEYMEMAEAKK